MDLKMKEALFAGLFIIIGAIISPLVAVLLQSSNMPPNIVDFSPDLVSPQPINTSITWIANARDPNNDPIYYKFQLKGRSTGNSWEDKQDWSLRNSWAWYASESDSGNNTIRVLVKDNKHVQTDIGDADKSDMYFITKSSRDWYNEAVALFSQGKYNDSIQCDNNALKLDPNNALAWNNKGLALLYGQSKYDEAIEAYDRAIRIDPQYAEAWNNKGNALFSYQGKYDEAIEAYDRAVRIDPQYARAWFNKGYVLSEQTNYYMAIEAYDRAIKIDPQYAEAWNSKGYALAGQGKYDDAIEAYDRALQIYPQYAWALFNKGYVLYRQGKYDEAVQAYDRGIQIYPQYAWAWKYRGDALKLLNRTIEADDNFSMAEELGIPADLLSD